MSIVGIAPPTEVQVGGRPVPINASHHCGARAAAVLDDPSIGPEEAAALLLANYYPGLSPASEEEAGALLDAALRFFSCGADPSPGKRRGKAAIRARVFDWEFDAGRVVADFQRFYGLDITDPALHVHWWRFRALFDNLPGDTSQTMQAMGVRARDCSDCKSPEERAALRARKRAVALPPRTAAEVDEAI